VRDLAEYIHQLKQHILPVFDRESLSKETLEFEYIFLQLRLKRGIDLGEYQTRFNCNFFLKYKTIIDRLIRGKFLQKFDHCVLLTSQGWLLADEIASSF
jgi:coproporphyrinogen III oxidase-like Fe-S oxidoreductase